MTATEEHRAAVVEAARQGALWAQDELVTEYLPLVYNIVGRALNGHADVDDVVQETMIRALGSLGSLQDPRSFRSWLVAIAMNQIRGHWRKQQAAPVGSGLQDAYDVADPGADFVDLTILRLGLEGQRREAAEATRWLDTDDRALLSLWWLEAAGELSRADVATAMCLSPQHTAVRVQRMKAQLETARLVVRALSAQPSCAGLASVLGVWDGHPSGLWRKRIARHVRDCTACSGYEAGLVPAEGLLVGLGLVPVALAGLAGLAALGRGGAPGMGLGHGGDVAYGAESGHGSDFVQAADLAQGAGSAYGADSAQGWGPVHGADSAHSVGSVYGAESAHGVGSVYGAESAHGVGSVYGAESTQGVGSAYGADVPADATSVLATVGEAPPPGPRSHRREGRIAKRRRATVLAAAAVVLVTGGTMATLNLLPGDGEDDKATSAADKEPEASTAPEKSPTPTPTPSSPSRKPKAKPSKSEAPEPKPSRTKKPAPKPPRTEAPKPRTTPPAAPANTTAEKVLALVNTERAEAGCRPVKLDSRLSRAAQLHSEDMSENGYFDHTGQDGRSFADRATAQGYPSPGAENIARGQNSPDSVMQSWMNSQGHRENILNCDLTTMGVGVVEKDWTWTQVFGR
ncbi:sigma-70 family RNA polymerase sigma factor [Streptomyces flavofungini]|uniref:sigma-70 family RNA polymerase sigma factor n=1 Tax=Streptomyces flavofungini TaxID=68200 RepID=UPI0025B1D9A4|nr:sigma-70 family RNA polymerase sigma factor [Streptomyces flavofungini]WJV50912.1 sigma-70 family RNA polymerase sigma factor [Streptomyces flavofungini]